MEKVFKIIEDYAITIELPEGILFLFNFDGQHFTAPNLATLQTNVWNYLKGGEYNG